MRRNLLAFQDFNVDEMFTNAQRLIARGRASWYEEVLSRFGSVLLDGDRTLACRIVVSPNQPLVHFGFSPGNVAAVQFLRDHRHQQQVQATEERCRPIRAKIHAKQYALHTAVMTSREMIERQVQAYLAAHGTSTIVEVARALNLSPHVVRGLVRASQRQKHMQFDLRRRTGARSIAAEKKVRRPIYRGPRPDHVDVRAWSALRRHRAA